METLYRILKILIALLAAAVTVAGSSWPFRRTGSAGTGGNRSRGNPGLSGTGFYLL